MTNIIVNVAAQHDVTPDQLAAGVIELPAAYKETVRKLITFDQLPTRELILERAAAVAETLAYWWYRENGGNSPLTVMIGGAPWFMGPLERALRNDHIVPVYAFSKRVSVEENLPDGTVKKTFVFKHEGFIDAV